jgi:hypothetical protein
VPLQELTLSLDCGELPPDVAKLLAEADRRCDEFFAAGLGRRFSRYLPSDPIIVYAAMAGLRSGGRLRGDVFCEWGCGFGVATCVASLIGFEAYGIEIEPELADRATCLAEDFEIPVEILNTSYLPEGYEQCDGIGGADLLIPEATTTIGSAPVGPPSYAGLDPDEVDLFFVYPWPGQEQLMMSLFTALASEGAVLLIYLGDREITAYLHTGEEPG